MRGLVAASVVCLLALGAAQPAHAQVSAKVLGGMTRAAGSEPIIAGSLGVRFVFIEVEGEVGRMFDILPSGVLDRLNELQREKGLPVQAIAKMPATYAMGSLRVISPAGPVRPFGTVGAGIARVEPTFDVVVAGLSLGDVFGLTSVSPRNDTMLMAGAGLQIDIGRSALLEVGYRHLLLFTDFGLESGLTIGRPDVSVVYGALGVRF